MIVSVSRRTDIPAFYMPWFLERVRQGYCVVPNPYAPEKAGRISLEPKDVDCLVFWTRFPASLLPALPVLERSYQSVVFVTLTGLPRVLEPRRPAVAAVLRQMRRLAALLGPERLVWRYDPVVLSEATPPRYHLERFAELAAGLEGVAKRVKLSLFEGYRKTRPRMGRCAPRGFDLLAPGEDAVGELFQGVADIASRHGMLASSCAQGQALADCGIAPGACIDGQWLREALGLQVAGGKDPAQRRDCGCLPSRDVGMYDTCLFGCRYCYATATQQRARAQHARHDPAGESLLPLQPAAYKGRGKEGTGQLRLPLD